MSLPQDDSPVYIWHPCRLDVDAQHVDECPVENAEFFGVYFRNPVTHLSEHLFDCFTQDDAEADCLYMGEKWLFFAMAKETLDHT